MPKVSLLKNPLAKIGLLATLLATAGGAHAEEMIEPVFGLIYDPQTVVFEQAPDTLPGRCPGLAQADLGDRIRVFGRTDVDGTQYWALGGEVVVRRKDQPIVVPKGAVVALTADGCTLLGPIRAFFQFPNGVPADAVSRLADEVVERYQSAYGGAPAFTAVLKAQGAVPQAPMKGLLRAALERHGAL
ncbi:hypothetical protein [Nitrospirillum viridazoti]|uniref:Uncharacterized protein n=1 Tax=Nitrospirillum amazonense TaxID=28077 RepID=A0A560IXG0_9PROT|nr:hypothetical protein [Nitrospirillum amazonense]TWB63596.1 hypothetical protein FBZ92_10387 [Nitrospirillum amazonense]